MKKKQSYNYNRIIYYYMVFIKLKHRAKHVATQQAHILFYIKTTCFL